MVHIPILSPSIRTCTLHFTLLHPPHTSHSPHPTTPNHSTLHSSGTTQLPLPPSLPPLPYSPYAMLPFSTSTFPNIYIYTYILIYIYIIHMYSFICVCAHVYSKKYIYICTCVPYICISNIYRERRNTKRTYIYIYTDIRVYMCFIPS